MLRSMWTVTRLRARSVIGGDVSEPDGGEHGDGEIHGTEPGGTLIAIWHTAYIATGTVLRTRAGEGALKGPRQGRSHPSNSS